MARDDCGPAVLDEFQQLRKSGLRLVNADLHTDNGALQFRLTLSAPRICRVERSCTNTTACRSLRFQFEGILSVSRRDTSSFSRGSMLPITPKLRTTAA